MLDFKVVMDMPTRMYHWRLNLIEVILGIKSAAAFFVESLDKALEFAAVANQVVALIGPAIEAINALLNFKVVQDMPSRMYHWRLNLIEVILGIKSAAAFFTESLEKAIEFAESAGKVVAIIQPAIEAIVAMTQYVVDIGWPGKHRRSPPTWRWWWACSITRSAARCPSPLSRRRS